MKQPEFRLSLSKEDCAKMNCKIRPKELEYPADPKEVSTVLGGSCAIAFVMANVPKDSPCHRHPRHHKK